MRGPSSATATESLAIVLEGVGGPFSLRTFPIAAPTAGTALLRVELCGICGTDGHIWEGRYPALLPGILGHEVVGTIASLGEGLTHDFSGQELYVGDRVVPRTFGCGRCYGCTVGRTGCSNSVGRGGYGTAGSDLAPYLTGGFAQYLAASLPFTALFKVDAPAHVAVLMEPLAAVVGGVDRAQIRLGETVVIQGTGAIGLLAVACARLAGADRIIALGGPPDRLTLALALGADVVIDVGRHREPDERTRLVRVATPGGHGCDVVFGCVGSAAAIAEGLSYLAHFGRMCEIGNAADAGPATVNPAQALVGPNTTLFGHLHTPPEVWVTATRLLERCALPFDLIVTHRMPLPRVAEAVATIREGRYELDSRQVGKVTVDPWA